MVFLAKTGCERHRLAASLVDRYPRVEACNDPVVVESSALQLPRFDGRGNPGIEPYRRILKIRRHHADNGVRDSVEPDLTADDSPSPANWVRHNASLMSITWSRPRRSSSLAKPRPNDGLTPRVGRRLGEIRAASRRRG